MANYLVEDKVFGVKREASRGDAETSAARYIPVSRDSEFEYKPDLLADEGLRGSKNDFPPDTGRIGCTGSVETYMRANEIGEFFLSALGAVSTTTPDISNCPSGRQHVFTLGSACDTNPLYTWFVDREQDVKSYNGCGISKLSLSGGFNDRAILKADIVGKSENEPVPAMSPSWATDTPLLYNNATVTLASGITYMREWAINIDTGLIVKAGLSGSQDIDDVLFGKCKVDGSFVIYFENETERDKAIANTASDLTISLVGGEVCPGTGVNYTCTIALYEIHYTAMPFNDIDGLIGLAATFGAFYSTGDSKMIDVTLINSVNTYA